MTSTIVETADTATCLPFPSGTIKEKPCDSDIVFDKARARLKKTFARSKLLDADHELIFPRFSHLEILTGEVLGKGGFGTVCEVLQFRVNYTQEDPNVAAFSFRSWASADNNEYHDHEDNEFHTCEDYEDHHFDEAFYETQFHDKRFIAENTMTVDTKKARYVVKLISPEILESNFKKFVQAAMDMALETHFLSIMNHPHILKMRGVGMGDFFSPNYFLVLDRLYDTLSERIDTWRDDVIKCNTFSLGRLFSFGNRKEKRRIDILLERLTVARNLADALCYLKGLRIIYRDLKPENIGFDARGVVKLFDFGLSKELHEEDELSNGTYKLTANTGSLRYMAPEVCNKWPYNYSADVYSFGILLWEIMSLELPFHNIHDRESMIDLVMNWGERPPINDNWTSPMKSLITSCWDQNSRKRPTIEDVLQVLNNEIATI